MGTNIVQLDIDKIDSDIVRLERELETAKAVKRYALQLGIKTDREPILTSSIVPSDKSKQLSVSPFIIDYLTNNGRIDTKSIVAAFAKHTQRQDEDVAGNVSNALSRLKNDQKIDNEELPGGRRAGSVWFIKPINPIA